MFLAEMDRSQKNLIQIKNTTEITLIKEKFITLWQKKVLVLVLIIIFGFLFNCITII